MKKKIMLTFATLIIFAMTIVAFAYNATGTTASAAASCCCCGDSCPMKNKDAKSSATADAKTSCDCCGDSCPMKGDHSSTSGTDTKGDKAMKDCPCCHHKVEKKDRAKTGV
jgi:hypothetical protein